VFNRADLAKLISAPKKTTGAAAKPQAAAAPPKPVADADSSDGEPPKTANPGDRFQLEGEKRHQFRG
jgi:hypothetical protein